MNDEAGFLKAIAERPAERSTRLVYADWLDEHDRPREAEFLRLQLQAAELNERLLELGGGLDVEWLKTIGSVRSQEQRHFLLPDGREITLVSLNQRFAPDSLVLGPVETAELAIEQIVADEQTRNGSCPYLIRPELRPFDPEPDPPPFLLITCVGEFRSFDRMSSSLLIIWFQTSFGFPLDPGIREQIRSIEWEKHAW